MEEGLLEEEIDLRPYIEALLRSWKWIIGAAAVAAVVALVLSSLITPTYEATALVAVTESGQRVQFDPRFETVDEVRPLKAYPELATSDELLQNLLSQLDPPLAEIENIDQLRRLLEAKPGSDPSLVRLTASYEKAAEAARVANTWAGLFVTRANEVYGDLGTGQVAFYESQLAEAQTELEAAEQALISFQSRDRTEIVNNELESLKLEQADNLTRQREFGFLIQDIEGLRRQLDGRENDEAFTYAVQLTALMLQIKSYDVLDSEQSTRLQLQIDPGKPFGGAETDSLDGLIEVLGTRSDQLEVRLSELEPRILSLQQQRQELEAEMNGLIRDREVANETYTALARKVEEERITSQDTGSGVRLASKAGISERPVSPRKLLNTVIAGALGGMFALFAVFVMGWWGEGGIGQEGRKDSDLPTRQGVEGSPSADVVTGS